MSITSTMKAPVVRPARCILPRWRRLRIGLAIALLSGLIAVRGAERVPTGPANGSAMEGMIERATPIGETIRLGAFNIHGGKGPDGRRDLGRTAAGLKNLDFIGLNEVHGACLIRPRNQTAELGQKLGAAWLFAPTEERWWHYRFGNGALSSLPVRSWRRIPLERRYGKSFRNVLSVEVEHAGRAVQMFVVHIDRSDERERVAQLEAAAQMFLAAPEPAVLMGDFNSDGQDPLIRRLLDAPGVREPVGETLGDAAPRRIDWIFTRGLETVDAGLVDIGASDHPHIWAELSHPDSRLVREAHDTGGKVR